MRLVIAVLALAVVLTASAAIGMAVLDGRYGHHDLRTIHYDTNYNLSSRNRGGPVE